MNVNNASEIGNNATDASIKAGIAINMNAVLAASLAANLIPDIIPPGIGPPKKPVTIDPNAPSNNAPSFFCQFAVLNISKAPDIIIIGKAASIITAAPNAINPATTGIPANANTIPRPKIKAPTIAISIHPTFALFHIVIANAKNITAIAPNSIAKEPPIIWDLNIPATKNARANPITNTVTKAIAFHVSN